MAQYQDNEVNSDSEYSEYSEYSDEEVEDLTSESESEEYFRSQEALALVDEHMAYLKRATNELKYTGRLEMIERYRELSTKFVLLLKNVESMITLAGEIEAEMDRVGIIIQNQANHNDNE